MQSFLMLPMQRITRLPLLISAISSRLGGENSAEFEPCQESLEIINKLVTECNDSALIEGKIQISRQILRRIGFKPKL